MSIVDFDLQRAAMARHRARHDAMLAALDRPAAPPDDDDQPLDVPLTDPAIEPAVLRRASRGRRWWRRVDWWSCLTLLATLGSGALVIRGILAIGTGEGGAWIAATLAVALLGCAALILSGLTARQPKDWP